MPNTRRFTALGYGNGFPFCSASSVPATYDEGASGETMTVVPVSFSDRAAASQWYWTSDVVEISIDIEIDYKVGEPNPSYSASYTAYLTYTDLPGVDQTSALEPYQRVCGTYGLWAESPDWPQRSINGDGSEYSIYSELFIPLDDGGSHPDPRIAFAASSWQAGFIYYFAGETTIQGEGIEVLAEASAAGDDNDTIDIGGQAVTLNLYATGDLPARIDSATLTASVNRQVYTYV